VSHHITVKEIKLEIRKATNRHDGWALKIFNEMLESEQRKELLMSKPKPKTTYIDDRQPRLKELQDLVGGLIQVVYADGGKTQIVMDEEGKLKGKPFNHEATEVWFPDGGILPDTIVGDAVVLKGKARLT
jgi:hypothetical protein